jgi:branched-chain amino acid transport system permease protein
LAGSDALVGAVRAPARSRLRWSALVWIAAAVFALLYPIPFQLNGLTYFQTVGFLVLLNATLGVGWNIIGGWAGQFDFGPNVFFAIGAYTTALLAIHLGLSAWVGLVVGAVVAVAVCALLTYPITRLRGHYFAIATVAMWMIAVPIGATWDFINGSQGVFVPLETRPTLLDEVLGLQFGGRTKELGYYYAVLALFALVLTAARVVQRSKPGLYFRAIRDDQEAAEGIGIDSRRYKVLARCMTAAVFATGGTMYAQWALAVFPDQVLDLNWSTLPMIAAAVGGIGRLWGPVVGALILIPLSQLMSTSLGTGPLAGRGLDVVVYGVIIMLVAALRPQGLLSLLGR